MVEALGASGYFRVTVRAERSADLISALDRGEAVVAIEIPRGFGSTLRADTSESARLQLLVDGTNSNTASVAQGYAERIIASYALRSRGAAPGTGIDLRDRAWYNPDLAS